MTSARSLEAVERRRLQLWILTAVLLVSISMGVVFISTWQTSATRVFAGTPVMRIAVVLLSIAFCVYAIEKERHLRKLSRLLIDERVLTTLCPTVSAKWSCCSKRGRP